MECRLVLVSTIKHSKHSPKVEMDSPSREIFHSRLGVFLIEMPKFSQKCLDGEKWAARLYREVRTDDYYRPCWA